MLLWYVFIERITFCKCFYAGRNFNANMRFSVCHERKQLIINFIIPLLSLLLLFLSKTLQKWHEFYKSHSYLCLFNWKPAVSLQTCTHNLHCTTQQPLIPDDLTKLFSSLVCPAHEPLHNIPQIQIYFQFVIYWLWSFRYCSLKCRCISYVTVDSG